MESETMVATGTTKTMSQDKPATARYFVAKYIPDLRRLEPRNVGVVVVTPTGVAARFLAERDQTGEVDGRALPGFVRSINAYKQWIAYWRDVAARGAIEDKRGETVSAKDARFAEVLIGSGKGTYCLVEGGLLLDRIPEDEVPVLANRLYRELIAEEPEARPTLDSQLRLALQRTNMNKDERFIPDYRVRLDAKSKDSLPLTFSYAFKNGKLERLYERVSLHGPQREKSFYAAAYKFGRVIGTLVEKPQTAALVYAPGSKLEKSVQQYLDGLRDITRVINLADLKSAEKEFAALPALAEHA